MTTAPNDPRYPIGKYEPQPYSDYLRKEWLNEIRILPRRLEDTILNMDEHQLNTPYRQGGWTVKQLIHHVADSHINAYVRFRLGLTETNPQIKPYEEGLWAQLPDSGSVPVNVSLTLLHALHTRWYETIKDLGREQWDRTVFHPEQRKEMSLWFLLGMYAWHGRHHVAHAQLVK